MNSYSKMNLKLKSKTISRELKRRHNSLAKLVKEHGRKKKKEKKIQTEDLNFRIHYSKS